LLDFSRRNAASRPLPPKTIFFPSSESLHRTEQI